MQINGCRIFLKNGVPETIPPVPDHKVRRLHLCLLVIALCTLFLLVSVSTVSAQDIAEKKVLILNSYHPGMVFSDEELRGIESHLAPYGDAIDVRIEYMDTKRRSDDEYLESLFTFYRQKYNATRFDVIVTTDDNAFSFIKAHRDTLFPGTPVVFCGINYFSDDMIEGMSPITGAVEDKDVASTLATAFSLFPETKTVYVIHDETSTGLALHKQVQNQIPQFATTAGFVFISNVTIAELQDAVRDIPPGSIILLEAFNRDRAGRIVTHEQIGDLVANATTVPIFGNTEMYLNHGIVGGKITAGYTQGDLAGAMVVRILKGEDADTIPVIQNSPNVYMFDYNKLSGYGISKSPLPSDSIVINKPPDDLIPVWIVDIAGVIILFMGILVILLIIHIRTRKQDEQKIRESEERYRTLYLDNPSMYFTLDNTGTIISVNPFGADQLGYTVTELTCGNVLDLYYPDDRATVTARIRQCLASPRQVYQWQLRKVRKDGAVIWVEEYARAITSPDGSLHVLVASQDITERRRIKEDLSRSNMELIAAYEQMTATAETAKNNYDELHRSQQALDHARRKLNLLNRVTFSDIQNAVFSISGYLQLEEDRITDKTLQEYVKKQKSIVATVEKSLNFARNYQDLGIEPPRWQNVSQTLLFGISHLDVSRLSRKIEFGNLEIYADPLLEKVFFNLTENVLLHGMTATEIACRYYETDAGLHLLFEDDGMGIPDSQKEMVFTQAYGVTKGMGLFLVREILSITGITIRETGEPGKGARFEMLVPKGMYRFVPET